MEMIAIEDVNIGQDLTPPLPPLAFSLYTSTLSSHCSACFSPLPPPPPQNTHYAPTPLYCSHHCSSLDSPLHLSSSESLLHRHSPDSSDLRLSLRLLRLLQNSNFDVQRLFGLLTNHHELSTATDNLIEEGVQTIANALGMDSGFEVKTVEAVLCLVITNAVEVQDNSGRGIGIAVYDKAFSWINHSCSPNVCYRFAAHPKDAGASQFRIQPQAIGGDGCERRDRIGLLDECGGVNCGYGPRVILRSITAIKKGEEVTITYTDLLQPKTSRQSELSMKYRFDCCCRRCNAIPATYVDRVLEETFDGNHCQNPASGHNEKCSSLVDWQVCYNDAITEYLSSNNPKSCCQKLENLLSRGCTVVQAETMETKPQGMIMIHPLNHLALNSYTVLASAYKVYAYDLLSESEKCQTEAFNMLRVSAAYSLMLALAAQHLLQTEASLVASAANFWTSAGESLLNLARSQMWDLQLKQQCFEGPTTPTGYNCSKCSYLDLFETISNVQEVDKQFEEITARCLDCIIDMRSRLWGFLVPIDCYLKEIEGSFHSNVFEKMESFKMCHRKESVPRVETIIQDRLDLFQLGIHCLLSGAFLSCICYGPHSHIVYHVKNIMDSCMI